MIMIMFDYDIGKRNYDKTSNYETCVRPYFIELFSLFIPHKFTYSVHYPSFSPFLIITTIILICLFICLFIYFYLYSPFSLNQPDARSVSLVSPIAGH